jgi:hypothetical protein
MQQYDHGSGDMGKLKCGVSKRSFAVSESELHILVTSTYENLCVYSNPRNDASREICWMLEMFNDPHFLMDSLRKRLVLKPYSIH